MKFEFNIEKRSSRFAILWIAVTVFFLIGLCGGWGSDPNASILGFLAVFVPGMVSVVGAFFGAIAWAENGKP